MSSLSGIDKEIDDLQELRLNIDTSGPLDITRSDREYFSRALDRTMSMLKHLHEQAGILEAEVVVLECRILQANRALREAEVDRDRLTLINKVMSQTIAKTKALAKVGQSEHTTTSRENEHGRDH